ncbi:hypothetical protein [Micrococcus sp.]|uniref:hypothetical protein n=1 Tax=Micrococcus sp. TaxID=1271 RepID=UPI0034A2B636
MGFARRAQREWDLPVHVHRADGRLARHPYRYRPERSRLSYPLTHPRSLPVLGGMAAADTAEALASLDAIASTGARTLLPGHGGPWHGGAVETVRRALQEGAH